MKTNSDPFYINKPSLESFMDECGPVVYLNVHHVISQQYLVTIYITVSSYSLMGYVLKYLPGNKFTCYETDFKETNENAWQVHDKIRDILKENFEVRPGIITTEIIMGQKMEV